MAMLQGKTCVVTGSTAGIGKAIAKSLLREGAFVFVNGRNEAAIESIRSEWGAEGLDISRLHGIAADLGKREGTQTLFDSVSATGRNVDVFVNNLGMY
jgi:3-oxoacyl-[acyl-carrier protein] reductase